MSLIFPTLRILMSLLHVLELSILTLEPLNLQPARRCPEKGDKTNVQGASSCLARQFCLRAPPKQSGARRCCYDPGDPNPNYRLPPLSKHPSPSPASPGATRSLPSRITGKSRPWEGAAQVAAIASRNRATLPFLAPLPLLWWDSPAPSKARPCPGASSATPPPTHFPSPQTLS